MRQVTLLVAVGGYMFVGTGCELVGGAIVQMFQLSYHYITTPLIPVSPYYSQLIEDVYWEEERYDRVPILDPVEGEHAPLFCLDPPSPDYVMRALPDKAAGGVPFLAETSRNNVRIVVEPIVDRLGECRFYPMVGPARMHHCHYKCTVYYEKKIRSDWPIPFSHVDRTQEVVYIDKNYLIRCAGPVIPN
jgi:hypothetical protein